MTRGSSPKLLIQEFIELLKRVSKIKATALDLQNTITTSHGASYVISWYLHAINMTGANIAMAASALEATEDRERSVQDFQDFAVIGQQPEKATGMNDLEREHQLLDDELKVILDAYKEAIDNLRPVRVIVTVVEREWRLASDFLKQSREQYDK